MSRPPPRPVAWVLSAFVLFCSIDAALTLHGQPPVYHDGEYSSSIEANPVACLLLNRGPMWFVAGALAWMTAVGLALVFRPSRPVLMGATVMSLTHAFGGSAWLVRTEPVGWLLAVCYLAVAVAIARACWPRSGPLIAPAPRARP